MKKQNLGKAVYDAYSRMLLPKQCLLTEDYIQKLNIRGYLGFYIEDEFSEGIEVNDTIGTEIRNRGAEALRKRTLIQHCR